jgi:hypothetical protein
MLRLDALLLFASLVDVSRGKVLPQEVLRIVD